MAGFITKKIGMTQYVDENGRIFPVTLLKVLPNLVLQVKSLDSADNADAVVLRAGNITKQFNRSEEDTYEKGSTLTIHDFPEVNEVKITSISKGKGFQGVVKRYNFGGGRASHGGKYTKAPGSIGTRKPRRTKKGQKLPGRMGFDTMTQRKKIYDIDKSLGVIAISGSVPGATNAAVFVAI